MENRDIDWHEAFRIPILVYLAITFLVVALWVGVGLYGGYDNNSGGEYCDYSHPEPNWETQGLPCRLNIAYFVAQGGIVGSIGLLIVQGPVYVGWFFLWRAARRRRRKPGRGVKA